MQPLTTHCLWGPVTAVEAAHGQSVGTVAGGEGDGRGATAGAAYVPPACEDRSLSTAEDFRISVTFLRGWRHSVTGTPGGLCLTCLLHAPRQWGCSW